MPMGDIVTFAAVCKCYGTRGDPGKAARAPIECCKECPYWKGNGAREALMEVLREHDLIPLTADTAACTDIILAALWVHGFRIEPLDFA